MMKIMQMMMITFSPVYLLLDFQKYILLHIVISIVNNTAIILIIIITAAVISIVLKTNPENSRKEKIT